MGRFRYTHIPMHQQTQRICIPRIGWKTYAETSLHIDGKYQMRQMLKNISLKIRMFMSPAIS